MGISIGNKRAVLEKIKVKFSSNPPAGGGEDPENYNFGRKLERNHRFLSMKVEWWNGIHAALKMLSRKLGAGSTPASTTIDSFGN